MVGYLPRMCEAPSSISNNARKKRKEPVNPINGYHLQPPNLDVGQLFPLSVRAQAINGLDQKAQSFRGAQGWVVVGFTDLNGKLLKKQSADSSLQNSLWETSGHFRFRLKGALLCWCREAAGQVFWHGPFLYVIDTSASLGNW